MLINKVSKSKEHFNKIKCQMLWRTYFRKRFKIQHYGIESWEMGISCQLPTPLICQYVDGQVSTLDCPPPPARTLTLSWDTASSIIKSQCSKPTHPPNPITCFTFRAPLDEGLGEGIGRKVVPKGLRETFLSSSSLICGDTLGKLTFYIQKYNL